jgi:hypothetical protein
LNPGQSSRRFVYAFGLPSSLVSTVELALADIVTTMIKKRFRKVFVMEQPCSATMCNFWLNFGVLINFNCTCSATCWQSFSAVLACDSPGHCTRQTGVEPTWLRTCKASLVRRPASSEVFCGMVCDLRFGQITNPHTPPRSHG